MRIISLETSNFGNLPNGRIELPEGLTVVRGPNEAGKSFMLRAIQHGLYGDGSASSGEVRELCMKWNTDGSYFITLELEHNGETYTLTRDFSNKKNILVKPDRDELKDKKKISAIVAGMVGLPSQSSYAATACIPQEEVEIASGEKAGLRKIIEERLAGSGSDTDKLVGKLEKKAAKILSRSGQKGELREQEGRAQEVTARLEEARARVELLAENKKRLVHAASEKEKKSAELADKARALKGSEKYIAADQKYRAADSEFDNASDNLQKCKQAKQNLADSLKDLEALGAKRKTLSNRISKADAFKLEDEKVGALELKLAAIEKARSSLTEIEKQLEKKRDELGKVKVVEPVDLRNAKNLPGEIAGLEQALSGQLFSVKVSPVGDAEFSLTVDGAPVEGPSAEAHAEALVDFPGVASVRFRNETGKEAPLVDEIDRKKSVLRGLLEKYKVNSVEELEALITARRELERAIGDLVEKKFELSSDGDLAELNARAGETAQALEKQKEKRDSLAASALAPELLESEKGELEKLNGEIRDKEGLRDKSTGVLEAVGKDEEPLATAMKEAAKKLAVAEAARDEVAVYKCSGEEFEKQTRQKEELERNVNSLQEDLLRLELQVSSESMGEEDVAVFEEQLSEAQRRVARLQDEHAVLSLMKQSIEGARAESISRFSEAIEAKMSEILSRLTVGKYDTIEVNGDLGVSVFSQEKGELIDLDDSKRAYLSSGALDQVYLAARLSLLDLITGDSRPPIILDDTFVTFDDMGRKDQAFNLLKSIAEEYQVLYFTCHNSPDDINTIEVG